MSALIFFRPHARLSLWGQNLRETEIPSELLDLVYATATDRSKWQMFCDTLSLHTTVPIMMFGHNLKANESLGIIAGGLDPVQLDLYHDYYADQNPWMHMNLVMPVGTVGVSDQALRREDLFKTEFYNDWLRPQENIIAGPATICHRAPDRFVAMAAACRARGIDDTLPNNHGLFEAMAPHLARSISISSILSGRDGPSFRHLENSPAGIVILRRSGRVLFVNRVAERFMSGGCGFTINQFNKLVTKDEHLRSYVSTAHKAMRELRYSALPNPFCVQSPVFGRCILHAHIFPADVDYDFPVSAWSDDVAGAIIITGALGLSQTDAFGMLARSLGATAAEVQLAEALLNGSSLYEYAERNTLSRHTVRNQMRSLLQKSGCRNQADFVGLMHRLASPFDSGQRLH